jgi:hypothetical protein
VLLVYSPHSKLPSKRNQNFVWHAKISVHGQLGNKINLREFMSENDDKLCGFMDIFTFNKPGIWSLGAIV